MKKINNNSITKTKFKTQFSLVRNENKYALMKVNSYESMLVFIEKYFTAEFENASYSIDYTCKSDILEGKKNAINSFFEMYSIYKNALCFTKRVKENALEYFCEEV